MGSWSSVFLDALLEPPFEHWFYGSGCQGSLGPEALLQVHSAIPTLGAPVCGWGLLSAADYTRSFLSINE